MKVVARHPSPRPALFAAPVGIVRRTGGELLFAEPSVAPLRLRPLAVRAVRIAEPSAHGTGVSVSRPTTATAPMRSTDPVPLGLPPALARLEPMIVDGIDGRTDGDARERDLVAIAETLLSIVEQRPAKRLHEFQRHRSISEPLASALADVRAFGVRATPEERVLAMTLLAATQFRLMANTTGNTLTLLFSGGARTRKRYGAAASYWTALAAAGGPSPAAALESIPGKRGEQARRDFHGEWEVLRKVQREPPRFPALPIRRTPARALHGAVLPAIATQQRFGGERAMNGMANGPLLQAAALSMFDRWAREDVVGVLTRSARRGDPLAFETLLLLGEARRTFGSTLSPATSAHFARAEVALRSLAATHPAAVREARATVARLTDDGDD